MRHPRLLPLLACAVFCLPACQQANDDAGETTRNRAGGQATEASPDGDGFRTRAAGGAAGVQADKSLPLPADFPTDVFLPGRYQVNSVMDMGGTQVVSVTTRGKVSDVHGQAQRAMTAGGWTQTMSMQHSADNAMLAYEKGERAVVLSFNKGEGVDGVVMAVQLRAQQP
ncbi:hypothetical protein BH23PSE2_BH23PSE2_04450 [soil metagenome]